MTYRQDAERVFGCNVDFDGAIESYSSVHIMHPALLVAFRRPGTMVIAPLSIAQVSLCMIKTGLLSPRFSSSYGLSLYLDPAVKVPKTHEATNYVNIKTLWKLDEQARMD